MPMKEVFIVGGGFAGVRCARDLAAKRLSDVHITLISNRADLEYYGAMYRLIRGDAPQSVCLPLSFLLKGKGVEIVQDAVMSIDTAAKSVQTASGAMHHYDTLVLALGAQTNYFGIPGMEEHSLTFGCVQDALKIKGALHARLAAIPTLPKEEQAIAAHFVVIGAGATGVEVASELITQGRLHAKTYGVDPALISVDLIEALPRVMALLPEDMSPHILARLHALGVNVYLDHGVLKASKGEVQLADLTIRAGTIVWTAGVKANVLFAATKGLETDKKGRVMVDEQLRAKGTTDVYVIGDGASTQYAGMAQTAIKDGAFVAKVIARIERKQTLPVYVPSKPSLALPVGIRWAAVYWFGMRFYGMLGWLLREAADIRAMLLIMSPWQVLRVLRRHHHVRP